MRPLDQKALRRACEEVAAHTMWQTPVPRTVEDIISSDEIEEAVQGYFRCAVHHARLLADAGEDPNLVTSAVCYLANTQALPPMRGDMLWFRESLFTLLLLARPSISGMEPSDHPFLDEILRGVAEAKQTRP